MAVQKSCIACGMAMTRPEDFAQGDTSKAYCFHCARADGAMKSYDEVLTGYAGYLVQSQRLDEPAARAAAQVAMMKLPAWQGREGGAS